MRKSIYYMLTGKLMCLLMLLIVYPAKSFAIPLFLSYSGNLNYSFGYTKAEQAENEISTLSATINANGFIWRPWFITTGGSLSMGVNESVSNTGSSDSTSKVVSIGLTFSVFPQSRFPFNLNLNRSDSTLENTSSFLAGEDRFTSWRIFMSQAYFARTGSLYRVSYDHNELDSEKNDFANDNLNASWRARERHHSYSANFGYSRNKRSDNDLTPEDGTLDFSHNYTPGTDLGVTSLVSYSLSDPGDGEDIFNVAQASSVFSWRPIHKPYVFSGGARIATSGRENLDNRSLSTNIGLNYQFTRRLRLNSTLSFTASETGGEQNFQDSESVGIDYSSQQYVILGFSYNWNVNTNINRSSTEIDGEKTEASSLGASFGHNLARSWSVGRASSLQAGFSQNFNGSKNSEFEDVFLGIGNGLNISWSYRGVNSISFASASLSDSRSFGENDQESEFQLATFQITEQIALSRVSSVSANASLQQNSQKVPEVDTRTTSDIFNANIAYRNNRAFGIYPLRFEGKLSFSQSDSNTANSQETTIADARLDYAIGLLTTSAGMRIMENSGGTRSSSINFNVTRAF